MLDTITMETFLLQGICCMRMDFKVENAAPESTRIWQRLPLILILISPWLIKEIKGNSLLESTSDPCKLWGGPCEGPPLEVHMEIFKLMLKNLHGAFEENLFSSIPVDYKEDIDFQASDLISLGVARWEGKVFFTLEIL